MGKQMTKLHAVIDRVGNLIWLDKEEPPSWFLGNMKAYRRYSVRTSDLSASYAVGLFMESVHKRDEAWRWLKTTAQSMEAV